MNVDFCCTYKIKKDISFFCSWLQLIDRFDWTMYFQLPKNFLVLFMLQCLFNLFSLLATNKSIVMVNIWLYYQHAEWIKEKKYLCCFGSLIVLCRVVVWPFLVNRTCEDCLSSWWCKSWLHVDSTGWDSFSLYLLGSLFLFIFIFLIFWSNMLMPVTSLEAEKWQYENKWKGLDWSMTNVSNAGYIYYTCPPSVIQYAL